MKVTKWKILHCLKNYVFILKNNGMNCFQDLNQIEVNFQWQICLCLVINENCMFLCTIELKDIKHCKEHNTLKENSSVIPLLISQKKDLQNLSFLESLHWSRKVY